MGLIFRTSSLANPGVGIQVKNAALTYAEGDGNFSWLANNLSGSTVTISGSTNVSGTLNIKNGLVSLGSNGYTPVIVTVEGSDYLYIGNAQVKSATEAGLYNSNGDQMIAVLDVDNENYYYGNGNYKFGDSIKRHEFTGSVHMSQVLNLKQQNILPSGTLGDLVVYSNNLWFHDGSSWREVNLL